MNDAILHQIASNYSHFDFASYLIRGLNLLNGSLYGGSELHWSKHPRFDKYFYHLSNLASLAPTYFKSVMNRFEVSGCFALLKNP
jgi:hypothetical protein